MAGLVELLRSKEQADSKRYGGLVSLLLPEDDSQGYNPFLKQTPGAEGNNPMAMDTGGQPIPPAPHWVNSLTGLVEGTVNGFMAPANALAGKYDQMVIDPETGKVLSMMDPRLMDDAAAMAGLVTLGSGAIPAEAGALRMGLKGSHGTTVPFDEFKPNIRKGEQLGFGIHFAEDPKLAERYAFDPLVARKGSTPRVIDVDVDLKNPLDLMRIVREGEPEFELAKKVAGKKFFPIKDENGVPSVWLQNAIDAASPERAQKLIQEAGYDGVKYEAKVGSLAAGGKGMNVSSRGKSFIVFDPSKIKILK